MYDTGRPRGQEVKGQGHRRPKLCLGTWRRHHSWSLESSRWRHVMSDGTADFENVLHNTFNCTPAFVRYVSCWRTCFNFFLNFDFVSTSDLTAISQLRVDYIHCVFNVNIQFFCFLYLIDKVEVDILLAIAARRRRPWCTIIHVRRLIRSRVLNSPQRNMNQSQQSAEIGKLTENDG